MKRTIAFLLACLMLLSLMACGKKNQKPETTNAPDADAEAQTDTSTADGMTAGEEAEAAGNVSTDEVEPDADGVTRIPYTSLDELNNALGGKVARPVSVDVDNEAMWLVKENGVDIEQYYFTISDIPCGVRFSPDFKADISGMTMDDGTSVFAGREGEFTMEYGGCEVARFETVDGQYVLVVGSNELQLFEPLLEELKLLASGAEVPAGNETDTEATGEVPVEE